MASPGTVATAAGQESARQQLRGRQVVLQCTQHGHTRTHLAGFRHSAKRPRAPNVHAGCDLQLGVRACVAVALPKGSVLVQVRPRSCLARLALATVCRWAHVTILQRQRWRLHELGEIHYNSASPGRPADALSQPNSDASTLTSLCGCGWHVVEAGEPTRKHRHPRHTTHSHTPTHAC